MIVALKFDIGKNHTKKFSEKSNKINLTLNRSDQASFGKQTNSNRLAMGFDPNTKQSQNAMTSL